ncbi:hypothetical protein DMENIID0001_137070 [Sergentomyia squamirostris]
MTVMTTLVQTFVQLTLEYENDLKPRGECNMIVRVTKRKVRETPVVFVQSVKFNNEIDASKFVSAGDPNTH